MKFNIIDKLKYIFCVYFTPLPYFTYFESIKNGNFAHSGIGLGLIYSQKMFWISNLGMTTIIYYKNNSNLYYINIFFSLIFIFLYVKSLSKIIYLIDYS